MAAHAHDLVHRAVRDLCFRQYGGNWRNMLQAMLASDMLGDALTVAWAMGYEADTGADIAIRDSNKYTAKQQSMLATLSQVERCVTMLKMDGAPKWVLSDMEKAKTSLSRAIAKEGAA